MKQKCFLLALLGAFSLFAGCGPKPPARENAKPSDLPAEMLENVVQRHWMRDIVKVKGITYGESFKSKGGRVPPGVKVIPAKVRVIINGEPEKDVQLYFYQSPFGTWETYGE